MDDDHPLFCVELPDEKTFQTSKNWSALAALVGEIAGENSNEVNEGLKTPRPIRRSGLSSKPYPHYLKKNNTNENISHHNDQSYYSLDFQNDKLSNVKTQNEENDNSFHKSETVEFGETLLRLHNFSLASLKSKIL